MSNIRFIITNLLMIGLVTGCSNNHLDDVVISCKVYEFGENIVHCGPSGCNYSTDPIKGEIDEPGGLTTITNLEEVEITLSYYPADDPNLAIENIAIPAGEDVSRFAGLLGTGRIEIFRDKGIFSGKGDAADIEVCFVTNKLKISSP
jgi:hypothetical protein